MPSPADLKYTKEHEWIRLEGDTGTIGITDYAQDQLGDIVFVELPAAGAAVKQMDKFGEIESVKATGDLNSGVSGEVVEVNDEVKNDPSLVNSDPHEQGWMIRVRMSDKAELEKLLTPEQYAKQTGGA